MPRRPPDPTAANPVRKSTTTAPSKNAAIVTTKASTKPGGAEAQPKADTLSKATPPKKRAAVVPGEASAATGPGPAKSGATGVRPPQGGPPRGTSPSADRKGEPATKTGSAASASRQSAPATASASAPKGGAQKIAPTNSSSTAPASKGAASKQKAPVGPAGGDTPTSASDGDIEIVGTATGAGADPDVVVDDDVPEVVVDDEAAGDEEEEEDEAPVVKAAVARPAPGRPPSAKEEPPPPFNIGERIILIQNTRPRTGTPIGDHPVGAQGRVETVLSQTAIIRFDRAADTKEVVAFACLDSLDEAAKAQRIKDAKAREAAEKAAEKAAAKAASKPTET